MSILKRNMKRIARVAGITLGDMSGTIVTFLVTFKELLIKAKLKTNINQNIIILTNHSKLGV